MADGTIKIVGMWDIKLHGPDGRLKDHRHGQNVITTVGKELLATTLKSSVVSAANTIRYIAIGTGSTAESSSDTALGTEVARASGAVTYTSGAIYEVTATFAAGTGTGAIAEYGLLNTSSAGTLFSRDTEAVINKGASDTLTVTTQVTFS
jgi:hypothetical protein